MGRKPCVAADHFSEPSDVGMSRKGRVCNYCERSKTYGGERAEIVANRKGTMENHLAKCKNAPDGVRELYAAVKRPAFSDNAEGDPVGKKTKVPVWATTLFIALLLQFQHDNLLPDTFIEKESTRRLFDLLCPGIELPSRRRLGGVHLRSFASECERKARSGLAELIRLTGGMVNLLSDVWQNISKTHLLGSQLTLFSKAVIFRVDAVSDNHDGLTTARELEALITSVEEATTGVGAVVTDDAGQCAKARYVLSPRWPRIVFLKCFAHDINNLVKAVLKQDTSFKGVASSAAAAVSCLNGSSSKWLKRVLNCMQTAYGDEWKFIALCETRWNSMQGCFASLLRVKKSIQAFHSMYSSRSEYPAALMVFGDPVFWSKLEIAERVIRPLSRASFRLQRNENTLADVVISFQEIHGGFSQALLDKRVLLGCLERRWRACEQPLFVLALFLHPGCRQEASGILASGAVTISRITDFAIYYYRRLIGDDYGYIRSEMTEFIRGTLTTAKGTQWPPETRTWEFWLHVKNDGKALKLSELAIRVLSIAVNTATCERLFSDFAAIHTKTRNRLEALKVKLIQLVREEIRSKRKGTDAKNPEFNIVDPTERPEHKTPKKVKPTRPEIPQPASDSTTATVDPEEVMLHLGNTVDFECDLVRSEDEDLDDMFADPSAPETIAFWSELLESMYANKKSRRQPSSGSNDEDDGRNEQTEGGGENDNQDHDNGDSEDDSDSDEEDDDPIVNVTELLDPDEEIPPPTTGPISDITKKKSKKRELEGIRGWKIELAKLVGGKS